MRTRGNFYVTAVRERDGLRYADQVGRQIKTFLEARSVLEDLDEQGYVQEWSERQQIRFVVAERDEAGVWYSFDPLTRKRSVMEPL